MVTLRWRVWYRSGLPSFYTCVYEYIEIFFDIFMAAWGLCCATGPWGSTIDSKGHNKVEERKGSRDNVSITEIVLQKEVLQYFAFFKS